MRRKVMQIALEALESDPISHAGVVSRKQAITALRQALETDLARVGEVGVWGECEPQEEVEDGWCDWVCPKPQGYLMQCCDCELIHEVDFRVVQYEPKPSEVYEVVDDPNLQAQMRLRRRDDLSPKREWVGLTDEEIDALSQARSLTDELMDCVDRLGSEADTVDPRVWQHLLVYAPKGEKHMSGDHNMKLIASLAQVNDFVMVHSNELQAILDYVEDMEQRIGIVREQLQYILAESVEPDAEPEA